MAENQKTADVQNEHDNTLKNPQRKSANWLRTIIWMFSMMFAFNIFAALIVYFFMAPK